MSDAVMDGSRWILRFLRDPGRFLADKEDVELELLVGRGKRGSPFFNVTRRFSISSPVGQVLASMLMEAMGQEKRFAAEDSSEAAPATPQEDGKP